MQHGQWFRPPRVILTLFFLLMAVCAAALGWLGWQLLEQDRAAETQRQRERLESASTGVAGAIQIAMNGGSAQVRITPEGVVVTPEEALAFVPSQEARVVPPGDAFHKAESLEFSGRHVEALGLYRQLASSGDAPQRAESLVRAARVLRRVSDRTGAMQVYRQLEQLGDTRVAGMPSGLVARGGRCSVLWEAGMKPQLQNEARALWADLLGGRFRVDRQTLETYIAEVRTWLPDAAFPRDWQERVTTSEALANVFRSQSGSAGKFFAGANGKPVSVVWESMGAIWQGRVAGPGYWRRVWRDVERDFRVQLRIVTTDGQLLHGPQVLSTSAVIASASFAGLPLQVAVLPAQHEVAVTPSRRSLLAAGLAVFAVLLISGTSLIGRAMTREIALARLQADFVAAVSHEFRTPLTGIRQLAEMLARGRLQESAQLQRSYELILSESERLNRLVESILDFGRMQSGMYQFRFEPISVAEWTRQAVDQFRAATTAANLSLTFSGTTTARVSADQEALRGALWNLLENAVKYSPDEKSVSVEVSDAPGAVVIEVKDRGMGIPAEELRRIFHRFYRGEAAKVAGAKGTGIGLALAKEVVEAHGGTIRAASEAGHGSTFSIQLPCEGSV